VKHEARLIELNNLPLPEHYHALAASGLIRRVLELARDEDLGHVGDVTSHVCHSGRDVVTAHLVARKGGVLAGLATLHELAALMAPTSQVQVLIPDGTRVPEMTVAARLIGPGHEVLALERTALNLIGRLSGIATRTRTFVDAIPPACRASVFDTRKTTPGLRVLEKYAVRCGGGKSHRMGLFDAVLIKDNHIAGVPPQDLAPFIAHTAARARALSPAPAFIEVEVDSLDQFDALLTLPAKTIDIVLLDNMPPETLAKAAARRDQIQPQLLLEASGGVTLDSIPAIASSGVDRISAGTLTHGAISLDVALDVVA
jgi:nicotinate-nucleotide pyrophosphorylase (carboxylating)